MVPPEFRQEAPVIELNTFTRDEIRSWLAKMEGRAE